MLSINTNLSSLIAQRSLKQSTNKLNQAIERMTTGAKINHAKDNAANYSICTNLDTKIGAYQVAEDNCAMGLDMLATANGTLDQIHDKLQRLRDLAVQVSNGTYGTQSRQAINAEANALVDEIERLYNTSEYNGINLMKGQVIGTEESNFIKDIDRRDTSKMTTLASVDETVAIESGTYSISTPEELAKLATMTNNVLIKGGEFVLANDIDLSVYSDWVPIGMHRSRTTNTTGTDICFCGTFDGNGYEISNLTINTPDVGNALFGHVEGNVKNLALTDSSVKGRGSTAILVASTRGSTLDNCCVINSYVSGAVNSGGVAGYLSSSTVNNCYFEGVVVATGGIHIGGIAGIANYFSNIKNSYVKGTIKGKNDVGGIVGYINNSSTVDNCQAEVSVSATNGVNVQSICGRVLDNASSVKNCSNTISIINSANILNRKTESRFQIGINNNDSCQIQLNLETVLSNIYQLRLIGSYEIPAIQNLDCILSEISNKQIQYGATENRLTSALEEISTQYENLVSSRSTLRDADIAEVSSEYIRQQILQQASATLMSTANQSASIALSLI